MVNFFSLPILHLSEYLEVVRNMLASVSKTDPDRPNLKEAEAKLMETDQEISKVDKTLRRLERLQQLQSKFEKKQHGGGTGVSNWIKKY